MTTLVLLNETIRKGAWDRRRARGAAARSFYFGFAQVLSIHIRCEVIAKAAELGIDTTRSDWLSRNIATARRDHK